MRLRTLLAGQPKNIVDALDACGIKTDDDLLFSASELPRLYQRLSGSVTFSELETVRNIVLDSLSAEGILGIDAFNETTTDQTSESQPRWTTNCAELNTTLGNAQSRMIEISGDTASAKTALILNIALDCLMNSEDGIVHWIDTTGDFSAERASKILSSVSLPQNSGRSEQVNVSSALDRLHVSLAFTAEEANAILEKIRSNVSSASGNERRDRVRLIVLEQITPLFAPYLSSRSSEGQAMLTAFMRELQDVTLTCQTITLIANSATPALPGNPESSFTATKLKPALGLTMTFLTDMTLFSSPARSVFTSTLKKEEAHKTELRPASALATTGENLNNVYVAEVLRSRFHAGHDWWSFRIDEDGVLREFQPVLS